MAINEDIAVHIHEKYFFVVFFLRDKQDVESFYGVSYDILSFLKEND